MRVWYCRVAPMPMVQFKCFRLLMSMQQALVATILVAFSALHSLPAAAQPSLPTLGDGSELTTSAERRLGDSIIRELYRDPDYIDDAMLAEYVQGIWQPLKQAAQARIIGFLPGDGFAVP